MRDNLADPGTDVDTRHGGLPDAMCRSFAGIRFRAPPATRSRSPTGRRHRTCGWATAAYLKKTSVPEWTPLAEASGNPVVWQGTLATGRPPADHAGHLLLPRSRARDRDDGNQRGLGRLHVPPERQHRLDRPGRPGLHLDGVPGPDRRLGLRAVRLRLPVRRRLPRARDRARRACARRSSPGSRCSARTATSSSSRRTRTSATSIDEGFTRIPAYAPRNSLKPTTYPDETTTYYWAVLPATAADGSDGAPARPAELGQGLVPEAVDAARPALARPGSGLPRPADLPLDADARRAPLPAAGLGRPDLRRSARRRLTDATSYSSDTTYPADTVLYWRVRADDENLTGLTWSATGTFQKKLGCAGPERARTPTQGDVAAGLGVELRPGRFVVRPRGRPAGRHAPRLRRHPHARGVVHQDDRHRCLALAGARGVPEGSHRHRPGPVLGDAVVHPHDRRAGEREDRQREGSRPAQLGSAPRREGVQGADRLDPGLQPHRRDGHDRQPELRADDDVVRLPRRSNASTGGSPASTRIATRATGRRRSRSSCCRG